jgi:porin
MSTRHSSRQPGEFAFPAPSLRDGGVAVGVPSDNRCGRRRLVVLAALLALAAAAAARAGDWPDVDRATGDWNGARTALEDRGVHFEANYTAETFTRDADAIAYHGNLDLLLGIDTEKAHLWPGGNILVYGEDGHGDGISKQPVFAMPVSNYEAPDFTQLSELWLLQELPHGLAFRLGKQDANRDFAAPRFGGNFMNSSFGVLPTAPIPSYPAPALGAAAFLQTTSWLELRSGIYEGDSRIQSVGGTTFEARSGGVAIGAANVDVKELGGRDLLVQLGGWGHTGLDRAGGFGIVDWFLPFDTHDGRSVQAFARGNFEPDATAPDAKTYLGGGLTAHGVAGPNNTVGLGFGWVGITHADQGFIEAFFKWRPLKWFSVEPDLQLYFLHATRVVTGLRCKVKL